MLISLWLLQLTSVAARAETRQPVRRWSGARARRLIRCWLRAALTSPVLPNPTTTLLPELAHAVIDSDQRSSPKHRTHCPRQTILATKLTQTLNGIACHPADASCYHRNCYALVRRPVLQSPPSGNTMSSNRKKPDPEKEMGDVSGSFRDLKQGRIEALDLLWKEYFSRLAAAAEARLGSTPQRMCDGEDIAISVFQSLCQGAVRGRFEEYVDRDDLWRLLLCITRQKIIDHVRREHTHKRGGGQVRGESAFLGVMNDDARRGIEQVVGSDPTPEFLTSIEEEHSRLINLLTDDAMKSVATMRFAGFSNEEIASRLQLSVRSVERKLARIRELWGGEFQQDQAEEAPAEAP